MAERLQRLGAVGLAVGLAVMLAACDTAAPTLPAPPTDGPTASPPPTAEPGTSLTPAPPATPTTVPAGSSPSAATDGWQYLAGFPAGDALEVTAVTAWQEGFVAVGFEPAAGEGFAGRRNGVLWSSANGRDWQRSLPPEFANVTLLKVLEHEGALYALGSLSICPEFAEDDECQDLPDAGIAAWSSADAAAWQRLALPDSLRLAILDGAERGPAGPLAFGSTGDEFEARIWTTTNGSDWNELSELGPVDPISALAAGPQGMAIFGTRYLADEDEVETLAALARAGDAFLPGQLPAGQRGSVLSVAWGSAGFVAVGLDDQLAEAGYEAVLLHSADGEQWTAAGGELPQGAGLRAVLALPAGYLALGSVPVEDGRERAVALHSEDGLDWRLIGELEGGSFRQFSAAVLGATGVIVFATDFDETDDEDPLGGQGARIHAWLLAREELPR